MSHNNEKRETLPSHPPSHSRAKMQRYPAYPTPTPNNKSLLPLICNSPSPSALVPAKLSIQPPNTVPSNSLLPPLRRTRSRVPTSLLLFLSLFLFLPPHRSAHTGASQIITTPHPPPALLLLRRPAAPTAEIRTRLLPRRSNGGLGGCGVDPAYAPPCTGYRGRGHGVHVFSRGSGREWGEGACRGKLGSRGGCFGAFTLLGFAQGFDVGPKIRECG